MRINPLLNQWKSLGSKTGTSAFTLPSSFNELYVVCEGQINLSLYVPAIYLTNTAQRLSSGYWQSGSFGARINISVSKTSCSLFQMWINGSDTTNSTTVKVYYR